MIIRWLHLSDVHECEKQSYHRVAMYEAIISEVNANPHVDFVFFTGDLAFSGTSDEYKLLSDRFLTPLRAVLPATCTFFMVPGNHDVDRRRVLKPRLWIVDEQERAVFQNVDAEGQRKRADALLPRFEAYRELEAKYSAWGQDWLASEQGSICKLVTIGSQRMAIVGINTAWLCQDDEDWGRLTAGRTMLDAALRQAEKAQPDLLVVLGHHPLAAMMGEKEWSDGDRIRQRLEQANAIYLHGHLHASGGQRAGEPMRSVLAVQAPSGFQAADSKIWRNGLLWGAADIDSGQLILMPKRWNDDHRAYVFDSDAAPPALHVFGQEAFSFPLPGRILARPDAAVITRSQTTVDATVVRDDPRSASFISNVIFDDNAVFMGRDGPLKELEEVLWRGKGAAAITQAAAIHGLGGVGKTTLAVEYARRNRDRYRGIWRLRGEEADTLIQDFALLRRQLSRDSFNEEPRVAARAALDQIGRGVGRPFLLIFDNIESPEDMHDWWPATGAQVLITSRWRDWQASKARAIALETLTPTASTNLLLTLSKRTERDGAGALAEELGHLPLALSHAGAVLRRARALTFDDYARDLEARIATAPKGAGEYPAAVRGALESNLAMLSRDSPDAHALLDVAAYCAPDAIPLSLWDTAPARAALPAGLQDRIRRAENFGALESWSLASLNEVSKDDTNQLTLSLHRLTQAVIRAHCAEAGRDAAVLNTTIAALEALTGTAAELPSGIMNTVNPHANAVRAHIAEQSSKAEIALLCEKAQALIVRTKLHCSFCQRDRDEVETLIVGPIGGICNNCIVRCDELLADAGDAAKGIVGEFTETGPFTPEPDNSGLRNETIPKRLCSYCGNEIYCAVRKDKIIVCDECIDLCMDILISNGKPLVRRASHLVRDRRSHNRPMDDVFALSRGTIHQSYFHAVLETWYRTWRELLNADSEDDRGRR